MIAGADFNDDMHVREVIAKLLLVALPSELGVAAGELVERVVDHPDVAPHADKLWGELREREGNIVAREVGLVARDVRVGAGPTSSSGERLH
jgi:hypothetical protein